MKDYTNELGKIYTDLYGNLPDDAPQAGHLENTGSLPGDALSSPKGDEAKEGTRQAPQKSAMEELDALIGLQKIKDDVKELISLAKIQKLRKDAGLQTVPVSLHLVFSGNPGTGKTTVARILARLYHEIGILPKDQLIEVDRSGLVAGYLGQTAIKTREVIEKAIGGILFIDEAYMLTGENDAFGQEAVDTILKAMEDHREDLIVIVAGYTDRMEHFINANPGLKSRFNKYFEFEDYTAEELIAIFDGFCTKYQYTLTPQARENVQSSIRAMEQNKGENFANARDVRNLFETVITNQAARIASAGSPEKSDLLLITKEDLDPDGSADSHERSCVQETVQEEQDPAGSADSSPEGDEAP